MQKKSQIILLIAMLFAVFIINYRFLDNALTGFFIEEEYVVVERIIDGDTIEIANKTSVRLLGINAPEKGEQGYNEAKNFLESEILNEKVKLEFVGRKQDKYYRTLAYVHSDGENVNVKLVEKGFANYYFYSGEDKYSEDLKNAWENCIKDDLNLCEASESSCKNCISLGDNEMKNNCEFDCNVANWEISGEGRKKFIFEEILSFGEKAEFELDLSDTGNTIFLRDSEGKLVVWEN